MTPVRIFHRYRGLRDFTMKTLIDAAGDLLPSLLGAQSRYKVSELPTERTLRYYMNQGLMDRPSGKRGTRSLFTYRHLLQVLAVKHLQSQYLPLRRIKVLLRGISNRELEGLLPGGRGGGKATGREKSSPADRAASGRHRREREEAAVPPPGRGRWVRVEISDGVELHLREDGSGPPMTSPLAATLSRSPATGRPRSCTWPDSPATSNRPMTAGRSTSIEVTVVTVVLLLVPAIVRSSRFPTCSRASKAASVRIFLVSVSTTPAVP